MLRPDAPLLFDGLTGRGLPLVLLSAAAGVLTVVLVHRRRYGAARTAAGLAVTAVIWGWAAGQYPYLLQPGLTIAAGAAGPTTLSAMLVVLGVGSLVLVPSLVLLYWVFQRTPAGYPSGSQASTSTIRRSQ